MTTFNFSAHPHISQLIDPHVHLKVFNIIRKLRAFSVDKSTGVLTGDTGVVDSEAGQTQDHIKSNFRLSHL